MVKLLEVIGRRSDWTHADFIRYQITTHLEVVDRVPEFRNLVRQYMQNHLFVDPSELALIKGLPISSNTDSIIEVWWDRVADIRRAFEQPRYFEIIRPDELAFGDVAGVWGVATHDTLIMERSEFAGLIKLFVFLKRNEGISHSDFLRHWRDDRDRRLMPVKTFRSFVGRYVENLVAQDPTESLPGMRAFDLVAELWFDSLDQAAEFTADPAVIAVFKGEGADYIDRARTLIYLGEEKPASAEWLLRGQRG